MWVNPQPPARKTDPVFPLSRGGFSSFAGAWRDSEGFPLRLFLGVMSFGVDKWPIMQVVVHNVTEKMQIVLTDLHLSAL